MRLPQYFLLLLCTIWCSTSPGWSQTSVGTEKITGHPYITNFAPSTYQAHKQNWASVQDSMGILYVANGDGVLIYNGSEWQVVSLPGESMASSIAIDPGTQEIFVGGWGTFGQLKYDFFGKAFYVPLSPLLGADAEKVTRIYETIVAADGVYFQTTEAIYRYRPNEGIHQWYEGPKQFGKLFYVNGRLLLKWHYKGIFELISDEWKLLPDSEQFGGVFVHCILPYDQEKLLFAINVSSLYLYDGDKFTLFKTDADAYLAAHRLYCGIQTLDSNYVFGTVKGGIVGIDRQGKINLLVNDTRHLLSLNIRNFMLDRNKFLVVAMDVGIAYLEYPSPITIFKIDQEEVEINDFAKFENQLYAGTETGLLKLENDAQGHQLFKKVAGFEHKIWGLLTIDDRLIVANEYGIHEILKNGAINTIMTGVTPGVQRSSINPNRIYVFLGNGITSLLYDGGRWQKSPIIPDFNRRVRKVIERDDHTIWLDTDWTESWKVNFTGDSGVYLWNEPVLTKYDTLNGMPDERGNLYQVAGSLYFVPRSLSANYIWDESSGRFEIDTQLHMLLHVEDKNVILWDVDDQKNCWYVSYYGDGGEHLGLSRLHPDGKYHPSGLQFDRILDDIGNALLIDNDTIWHGGFSSIVKQIIQAEEQLSKPLISIAKVIYQTDSTLSFGIYNQNNPRLPHKQNAIDFQYGITEFNLTNSIFFQTYLEGYDTAWSVWSKEKHRQFFGLSPGQYIFQVRALDGKNQESKIGQYTFTILSPWYRQWWAYGLYLCWGILIIGAIVRWRSAELIQENEKLEAIVRQRTEEVEIRNQQLENQKSTLAEQARKLQELDQLKTNLFANISHEFRTPLTLIKAPVEQMEKEPDKILSIDEMGMIRRNADRLLRLVNQLLDLAKLDARSLKLNFTEGDVYRFFRVEASSFGSLAAQKNIDFEIRIPTDQLWTSFDREKLETIVYNLLNNAFKFTPSGGKVKLLVSHHNETLRLEVTDTGTGIAGEHLDQVFNRFYQVEKMSKTGDGGTGIGLALCRELAILMKGEIKVKSRLDHGTSFYLTIPLVEIINSTFTTEDEKIVYRRSDGSTSSTQKLSRLSEIVLVVEDHPEMRRYIKSVLEKEYFIVEAEDGKSGFEKALKEIPDLIVTDTMMPSMDGHEFSQAIKNDERTSHIPIVMLTAKATLENKLVGLSSGVDSYLTKPFNAAELDASIKALLLERKRLRKLFSKQLLVAPKEFVVNSMDQQFLERVNTVLESQYSDSNFGVPQMQTALVLSKTQLHRKLTAITNQSPGEFLRNFRLQRAAQILSQKGDTVTQVAYTVGFENVPYFTKCFKALFGVNPSQYGN